MFDVIIVGSGVAGVGAALELVDRGIRPLLLDVGNERPATQARADTGLYAFKAQHDSFALTLGETLPGLSNILGTQPAPVKLTTPNMEYVTRDASRLGPIDAVDFSAIQSFATGGLANAWGAGLYRFAGAELDSFPIDATDLDPYFDKLTAHIGIAGTDDDLTPFFGSTRDLLPPIRLSHNTGLLYDRYRRRPRNLSRAFHVGHPRVGVLSQPHRGRPAFDYTNLEFWQENDAIYNPRYSLDELVDAKRVIYRRGVLVRSWEESDDGVTVLATDLGNGESLHFSGRKLMLAAGAINTSKIVLQSFEDYDTRLGLLENPAIQIPFVMPSSLGCALDVRAFGLVGLNLIWESDTFDALCQGSIMEITSPMRAEFFASLPYAAHANLGLIRHLLPAMIVMQFYLPGTSQSPSQLSLHGEGRLRIDGHANMIDLSKLSPLLGFFRRLGAWTHRSLIVRVPMGHAVHYAGTLPMRRDPGPYECSSRCELHGTRHVFVADSAAFTTLPAKNMSFAMMANAMRVSAHVADTVRGKR